MEYSPEAALYARTSALFWVNALLHIFVCILTLFFSVKSFKLLCRETVFHEYTRQLLLVSVIYADFHAMSYGFLQVWSLYRSIAFANDPSRIMFTGRECFVLTWIVGAAKMSMSFIQVALTVERLSSIFSTLKAFSHRGFVLNVLAALTSFLVTLYSYSEGPTDYKLPSCIIQKDIPLDRVIYALGMYFVLSLICLVANLAIIAFLYNSKKRSFNLKVRFTIQEVKYSSLAVSMISIAQFVAMTIYVVSNYFFIFYMRYEMSSQYFHNILLVIYTIPYAGLCLPVSVIICEKWISDHRKIKIVEMTKINRGESLDNRMSQLKNSWDSMAPKL